LLVLVAIFFSVYHGGFLLSLNKKHIGSEFDSLRDSVNDPGKQTIINKLRDYVLNNTHVNITKDYLWSSGNPNKEESRKSLLSLIEALNIPYYSNKSALEKEDFFLLNKKLRIHHSIYCLLFALSAIVISSLTKFFGWK